MPTKFLVTGAAGFIGFHLCKRLVADGHEVVGIDNLNDYYDPQLKLARLRELGIATDGLLEAPACSDQPVAGSLPTSDPRPPIPDLRSPTSDLGSPPPDLRSQTSDLGSPPPDLRPPTSDLRFIKLDLVDREGMSRLFEDNRFDVVINLAAQAGVRYSIKNPHAYIDSNIVGFLNVLEGCRHNKVKHLVYASSSSVYGANTKMPFSVHDNVDHPVSLYAATKKANELMAHSYASLYGLPVTGLRFFTVYGPWGRPDMAYYSFTKAILEGRPIDVYNEGKMKRDFTYIDDIIEGVVRVAARAPAPDANCTGEKLDASTSYASYRLYNIGNNNPVELTAFINAIEHAVGRQARINLLPMQAGDVLATCADIQDLARDTSFAPTTSIEEGIGKFARWYLMYGSR